LQTTPVNYHNRTGQVNPEKGRDEGAACITPFLRRKKACPYITAKSTKILLAILK
jgi:hypothetical protein